MTHVERLWLLCLAYASATATPTTPLVVLLFVTPLVVGDGTCKARLASQVDHNCAIQLADDTLVCWGQNNAGQSTPPSDQFSYVAAGEANSIGILASDGTPRIWGPDGGDGIVNNLPTAVASKAIDIGPWHGCLLRADTHAAQCWGYNRYGQGNPPAPLSTPYSEIHTSKYISCGLREADALIVCWAWGMSSAMAAVSFSTFEIGYNDHMCGLRQANGFAACWRGNTNHDPPVELQSVAFSAVTVGNGHFCALTQADHTARCWGTNDRGQATVPDTSVPYLAITAGHSHTCAVRASDGGVDCWGRNDNGQTTVPAGLIACAPPPPLPPTPPSPSLPPPPLSPPLPPASPPVSPPPASPPAPPPPVTGIHIRGQNAKLLLGASMACTLEFRPGPPPYLESNCPIGAPPPAPGSPPSPPPPSPSPPPSPPPPSPPPSTPPSPPPPEYNYAFSQCVVSTLAGSGANAFQEGIGTSASFGVPHGLAITQDGASLIIGDSSNNRVRLLNLGTLQLLAAALNPAPGHAFSPSHAFSCLLTPSTTFVRHAANVNFGRLWERGVLGGHWRLGRLQLPLRRDGHARRQHRGRGRSWQSPDSPD